MKLKIGFICVHNSCRSIMAEAITKKKYSHIFDAYSGGTHIGNSVNSDAINVLSKIYGIENIFYSKSIDVLPQLDIVVTMGCNVDCPNLPSKYRTDFGISDPSGMSEEVFIATAKEIENKIDKLVLDITNNIITL